VTFAVAVPLFVPKQLILTGVTAGVPVKFKKVRVTISEAPGQVPLPVVVSVRFTVPAATSAAVGI